MVTWLKFVAVSRFIQSFLLRHNFLSDPYICLRSHPKLDRLTITSVTAHKTYMMIEKSIVSILSQYELLERTARHLSALDLLHLGLTCSDIHVFILDSRRVFDQLKRLAVCDGRGLDARQQFQGLYEPCYSHERRGGPKPEFDEEIEIRVWNLKCDSYNALPCIRCGVNICEVNLCHPPVCEKY